MALSVVEGRLTKARAARAYGASATIVARWVERVRAEGRAGMADRSSRRRTIPRATAPEVFVPSIAARPSPLVGAAPTASLDLAMRPTRH